MYPSGKMYPGRKSASYEGLEYTGSSYFISSRRAVLRQHPSLWLISHEGNLELLR